MTETIWVYTTDLCGSNERISSAKFEGEYIEIFYMLTVAHTHLYTRFCPFRYAPYVGYVTIMLNDYPKLKYLLLGALGLSLLLSKEEK